MPASLPRFATGSGESGRLRRHKGDREVGVVASPVRPTGVPHGGTSSGIQADAWEKLLTDAGLEERDARPLPGGALTPTQATRLLSVLLGKPVTLGTFPARMAVGHLLREVLADGEVSRDTLLRRVDRFRRVAVLRPDGHLAWVWTGRTQQKAGALKWKDGTFRAGPFELGRFYVSNGFVIELADAQLAPVHGPVFVEVYDDADFISRTLDGAEAAFVKLALALGQFLTSPRDSIAALKDLPAGVVALIASSPEYFERFRYMTRGEQVQAVAELTTSLLVTKGTATSATRTVTGALAGAEATVPVLSLSAQGALTLERVAVPVGRAASALSGGPGAAILLQRANTATPPAGPGQWGPARESMSERARRYQEQISGHSADEAYWVGGVGKDSGGLKFDGFADGVLLEAKGPGYANKFLDNLSPRVWFQKSGAKALVEQAQRQLARAPPDVPIRWHVAELKTTEAIRELFRLNGVEGIDVVFTPPIP
ncbi:Tox-REase-5 domain-containing protein [Corallococcus soli]